MCSREQCYCSLIQPLSLICISPILFLSIFTCFSTGIILSSACQNCDYILPMFMFYFSWQLHWLILSEKKNEIKSVIVGILCTLKWQWDFLQYCTISHEVLAWNASLQSELLLLSKQKQMYNSLPPGEWEKPSPMVAGVAVSFRGKLKKERQERKTSECMRL